MYNYNVNKDPEYLKQPRKWFMYHPLREGQVKKAILGLPKGDVTYLKDWGFYRLRVGNIRILYDVLDGRVIVFKIDSRGDVYKGVGN